MKTSQVLIIMKYFPSSIYSVNLIFSCEASSTFRNLTDWLADWRTFRQLILLPTWTLKRPFVYIKCLLPHLSIFKVNLVGNVDTVDTMDMVDNVSMVDSIDMINMQKAFGYL